MRCLSGWWVLAACLCLSATPAFAQSMREALHVCDSTCGWSDATNVTVHTGAATGGASARGVNDLFTGDADRPGRWVNNSNDTPFTPDRRTVVKYFINNTGGNLNKSNQTMGTLDEGNTIMVSGNPGNTALFQAIRDGVESWNLACGLLMTEVFTANEAQIIIGTGNLSGSTIGLGGFRASTFNGVDIFMTEGFVQLDNSSRTYASLDQLRSVIVHEIGHALGLRHSDNASIAIMFPSIANPPIIGALSDDRWYTQFLYGVAPARVSDTQDNGDGSVDVTFLKASPTQTGTTTDPSFQGGMVGPNGPGTGTGIVSQNSVVSYTIQRSFNGGSFTTIATGVQATGTNNADPEETVANNSHTYTDNAISQNGNYRYRVLAVFQNTGTDNVVDGVEGATVAVAVPAGPVANDDGPGAGFEVDEDTLDNVLNVIANDVAGGGGTLSITSVTDPANGTANINGNTIEYTPDADFFGTDTFMYQLTETGGSTPGTSNFAMVTVTVFNVNDDPTTVDWFMVTDEDQATNDTLTFGATDLDNDPLTFAAPSQPLNGSLSLNPNTGVYTYTPDLNFNGLDTFTYRANDGTVDSNESTVTIFINPVNDPPVAVIDILSGSTSGVAPFDVTFDGTDSNDPVEGGTIIEYHWDFGDGTTLDQTDTGAGDFGMPMHTYLTSGQFIATLWVMDSDGLTSEMDSLVINVSGGAGDTSLYVAKGAFSLNRTNADADAFSIAGNLNSGLFPANFTGVTLQLNLNGTPVGTPVSISGGSGSSSQAEGDFAHSIGNGKYKFSLKGANLGSILDVADATASGTHMVDVQLDFGGSAAVTLRGQFEFFFKAKAGKTVKAKFSFKKDDTASGVFVATKTKVTSKNGEIFVNIKGVILAGGALPVNDGGPDITVGSQLLTAGDIKKVDLNGTKRSFLLITNGLTEGGTGLTIGGGTQDLTIEIVATVGANDLTFTTTLDVSP